MILLPTIYPNKNPSIRPLLKQMPNRSPAFVPLTVSATTSKIQLNLCSKQFLASKLR